ncbi:NAD(P)H-dependent oxidoreductase [Rhodococcus erythropolis]|uniref:NAD(P)H-dependent oxidoreductase n=1 Tax=Rhodococcus erythropolis TaxID=1833 RepID=UPI00294A43AE|nr:NAD(P)H-dependent oxidoreductase [Rhodococcus erythropolis]MDV6272535.1 NAD(P)H-dependent oxidoreductase [Rhodococcus erythropolis]
MSTPLKAVAIVGNLQKPSKTRALVDLIVETFSDFEQINARVIEIVDLIPGLVTALDRNQVDPVTAKALAAVESADVVIAASPVFRGSYTGLFKHFFDLVDQYALANTPVILAATGVSDRHALVLDHALRPLFAYFQALTAPVGTQARRGDRVGSQARDTRTEHRNLHGQPGTLRDRQVGGPYAVASRFRGSHTLPALPENGSRLALRLIMHTQ